MGGGLKKQNNLCGGMITKTYAPALCAGTHLKTDRFGDNRSVE